MDSRKGPEMRGKRYIYEVLLPVENGALMERGGGEQTKSDETNGEG